MRPNRHHPEDVEAGASEQDRKALREAMALALGVAPRPATGDPAGAVKKAGKAGGSATSTPARPVARLRATGGGPWTL
jgi:hypothetical protein